MFAQCRGKVTLSVVRPNLHLEETGVYARVEFQSIWVMILHTVSGDRIRVLYLQLLTLCHNHIGPLLRNSTVSSIIIYIYIYIYIIYR